MLSNEELMNGHPLRVLRTRMDLSQRELAAKVGVSEATIIRAENGHRLSPKVRRLLCDCLGMTSEELGLMGRKREVIRPASSRQTAQNNPPQAVPAQLQSLQTAHVKDTPTLIIHTEPSKPSSFLETQQEQTWLTLGASSLGQLFDKGWSVNEILESVKIVLQGLEGMSSITRQNLLVSNTHTMIRDIPTLTSKCASQEELAQLHYALSESIGAGWKLFHTASNAQVLAVGQALLTLIRHHHAYLMSPFRAIYYSSIYNLLGLALYCQERYQSALDMHMDAHIAASATGDTLYIVQSLTCQANAYQALGRYSEALQAIEEALRMLRDVSDAKRVQTKAHLLACAADYCVKVGDYKTAQKHLEASEVFVAQISPNEEFDATSWHFSAGYFAFATGNRLRAISCFEKALSLPQTSNLRYASTSIALATTYLYTDESASLTVIEQNASVIETVKAPLVTKQLADYIQQVLLVTSPENKRVKTFIADMQHRIPSLKRYIATLQ